jgi:hypothetical protein
LEVGSEDSKILAKYEEEVEEGEVGEVEEEEEGCWSANQG